jgi:hypothetical protein
VSLSSSVGAFPGLAVRACKITDKKSWVAGSGIFGGLVGRETSSAAALLALGAGV